MSDATPPEETRADDATPLVDEKRARILEAALSEFASKGYERASTNAIAQAAGVAKGLVFHRFSSKAELFYAVCDDVITKLGPTFERSIAEAPRDLFDRVIAWTEVKIGLIRDDPRRLRFFLVALTDAPPDVRREAMRRMEALMKGMLPRFLDGLDGERLRAGVRPDEALNAIFLLAQGYERAVVPLLELAPDEALPILERTLRGAKRMFELLRDGIYSARHTPPDDRP